MPKVESWKLIGLAEPYQLIGDQLYIHDKDDIISRCALPHGVDNILFKAHDGIIGGHLASELTTYKFL